MKTDIHSLQLRVRPGRRARAEWRTSTRKDTMTADIWYPDPSEPVYVEAGLMGVGATDTLRVHFSSHRNGWVMEQAKYSDEVWTEVGFAAAYGKQNEESS